MLGGMNMNNQAAPMGYFPTNSMNP